MPDYSKHPLNKKYDLDTALSGIWEFYKKWFGKLFVISFVFSLVITYVSARIDVSEIYSATTTEEIFNILGQVMGPYLLVILFTFVFTLILQYYVLRKPVDEDSNVFTIAIAGLTKFFLPLLVLNIFLGIVGVIAVMFGLILLFIGAVFAAIYIVMLAAIMTPVLMVEEQGIGDTITRTFKLAHGRFWQNFGWAAVFGILVLIIGFILGAIVMIPFGGSFIKSITDPGSATDVLNLSSKPSFIILNALANALTMPLFPIFSLVLYFNATSGSAGRGELRKPDEEDGGKVTIDDLYSKNNMDDNKSGKNTDSPPPRIEDLTP